jgi:hypothetical protein
MMKKKKQQEEKHSLYIDKIISAHLPPGAGSYHEQPKKCISRSNDDSASPHPSFVCQNPNPMGGFNFRDSNLPIIIIIIIVIIAIV